MPALESLTRPKLVTVAFSHDGEVVTIRYDRNKLTTGLLASVQEAEDARALAEMYATVIEAWDVTENDGSPFPPTADNLARLPLEVLRALGLAIRDSPTSEEGKDSFGPSSTPLGISEARSPTFPNGPVTLRSPESSTSQSLS